MKILFVHEVNYLEKVVFEMHEFPERLSKDGHEVIFVDYAERKKPEFDGFFPKDRLVEGRSDPSTKLRLITVPQLFSGTFDRLVVSLMMIFYAPILLRRIKPDVVISYAVPTMGWQFNIASHIFGIPFVYRAIDVSHLIRDSRLSALVRIAEKYMFRNSSLVLFNNSALCQYGVSLGCPLSKAVTLFPGFDEWPSGGSAPRHIVDLAYNTVFLGTLFSFSGLDWFVTEMGINAKAKEITLLIIGHGELEQKIRDLVEEYSLADRVHLYGRAEYDEIPILLSQAKIAIIPFEVVPVTRLALPGKVPQYIRSSLPTVSVALEGLQTLLPNEHGVVYAGTRSSFIELCASLLADTHRREMVSQRGKTRLDEATNWNLQIEELTNLLTRLTNRH